MAPLLAGLLLAAGCTAAPPATLTPALPLQTGSATTTVTTGPTASAPAMTRARVSTAQGRGAKLAPRRAELAELGTQLTAALASGDVEQWLALCALSPEAEQQQRDWYAGVRAVPMQLREIHVTDVVHEDAAGEVDGPVVEFALRHQVSGADAVPSVEFYEFTLEREGVDGPFRVVDVGGSTSFRAAYPQLWDVQPVAVFEAEHVIVLTPQETASEVEPRVADLESAAAAVLAEFPVKGVNKMMVTVVDQDLLATLFGSTEVGKYAGFTVPVGASPRVRNSGGLTDVDTGEGAVTSRIVLDQDYTTSELDGFEPLGGGSPLLRHEGLHLAMMLGEPAGYPPPWVSEGMAGWLEVTGDEVVRKAHLDWYGLLLDTQDGPTALPPNSSFDFFGDATVTERNYAESATVFIYLEERYGHDAAATVGRELHAMSLVADEGDAIDEALRGQVGIGRREFQHDWLAWVKELTG